MSNQVSLTFAGDTKSLDAATARAGKDLDAFGKQTQNATKHIGGLDTQLEHSTRNLRGGADVIDGLSTAMGGNAGMALTMTRGLSDITDGAGVLIPKLKAMTAEMSTLKFTGGLLAGVLGGIYLGWQAGTWAGDKLNDMLGRTPSLAEAQASQIRQNTQDVIGYATALYGAAAAQSALFQTKALTTMKFHAQTSPGAGDWMQGPVPLDSTGHLLNSTNGGNSFAAAQIESQAKALRDAVAKSHATGGGGGGGSAMQKAAIATGKAWVDGIAVGIDHGATDVASAISKVVDKAKATLDKAKALAKQIAQTFTYSLNAQTTDSSTNMRGPSLLQNFKDQVANLHKFREVIAQLKKQGLNGSMLSKLVDAGPDAMGAAQEILSSGDVGQLNKLQKTYKADQTGLANSEVMRRTGTDLGKSKPVKVTFDVTGADKAMRALIQKIVRVEGGGDVQVAFGKGSK